MAIVEYLVAKGVIVSKWPRVPGTKEELHKWVYSKSLARKQPPCSLLCKQSTYIDNMIYGAMASCWERVNNSGLTTFIS